MHQPKLISIAKKTAEEQVSIGSKEEAISMIRRSLFSGLDICLFATCSLGLPVLAFAADPAPQFAGLEQVIVTSQKSDEILQEVPVPVTSLAASKLTDNNQFRMQDYYNQVPGLALTPSEFGGAPSVAIRGITSGDATNPTVGIVVDDMPFGSSTSIGGGAIAPDFDPSDVSRVEVNRGPQGTLYGASSIGGLIKYITTDPTLDALTAQIRTGVSQVNHGDKLGYNVSAGVNVPIGDAVAVRVRGFKREDPGYIDNIRQPGGRDVNMTRATGGHVTALWQPSDDFSLKLHALIQNSKRYGAPFVTVTDGSSDFQQSFLPGSGTLDRHFNVYSATATASLGKSELTSVTGYSVSKLSDMLDYTTLNGDFTEAVYNTRDSLNRDKSKTNKFNQELRLSSSLSDNVESLVGFFYTHENSPYELEYLAAAPNGQQIGSVALFKFTSTYAESAAFANLTYHFTDEFDVQFGGRTSRITQTFRETDTGLLFEPNSPVVTPESTVRERAQTYLLTPRYKFSPDLMIYARLASGYRPGGVNVGNLEGMPPSFKPDKTKNYEIGAKGSALDNTLSFDGSLYYIEWVDIQLSLINPANGQNYFANGSQAKSEGAELSMQYVPIDGLRLDGWVAWNKAVLTKPLPENSTAFGDVGARLPYSARLSANTSINYEFPLAGLKVDVGSTVSYVGERVGAFLGDAAARQHFPAYTKVDLHAGTKFDLWTVDLSVNNATNKRGVLGGGLGTIEPTSFQLTEPRTVGLSVARTFE